MKRRDWISIVVIGGAVGLLSQAILANVFSTPPTLALRVGVFAGFTILAPLALVVLYWLGKFVPVLYQFGKFAAVGVMNTFVDVGVLNLEILIVGSPGAWGYRMMKAVSFVAATTNSFFWNKFWTFDSREPANASQTVKFYAVAVVGFLLNVGVASVVFTNVMHPAAISNKQWANVGALAGVAASFLWDFLGYKYLVFKKTAERL